MQGVRIINHSYSEVTQEADPHDEWSADSTRRYNDIRGFELAPDKARSYRDLEIKFNIDENKEYYLLCVSYSTGDSFSNHDGQLDYIELYEDKAMADAAMNAIELDYKIYKKKSNTGSADYSVTIKNNENNTFKISCSWKGYFESMESVDVIPVKLIK